MRFLHQIKIEFKNIFRSKFLMIIGILILAASIVLPILSVILDRDTNGPVYRTGGMFGISIARGYNSGEEPIIVDGVTIDPENPFYWNVRSLTEEKSFYEGDSSMTPQAMDLVLEMLDMEIDYYVRFAAIITDYEDYRMDLAWTSNSKLYDKFIHEHYDPNTVDELKEALSRRYGMNDEEFEKKYVNITSEERLKAIDEVTEYLDTIYDVVESNDFTRYIDLRIQQSNDEIANLEEQIQVQEQAIIDNPSQEESLSKYIEELQKQIDMIETNTIPILEYRLEHNIIPGDGTWQNEAINELEMCRSQLMWTTIMTEEEFGRDQWMIEQYGSYPKYVAAIEAEIKDYNNRILIAQKCLDTGLPDMKFVPKGARSITVDFLGYSTFIALFAVMLGGWIIASEFQQGTIRLLMIRPRTRLKILMSKYLAVLLLCMGVYAAGSLLNMITNGICFGFKDFFYPNVTVSGPVNFFLYYLPRFLACLVPVLFGFSVAFMISVLARNTAVAIAVPIFCFIGSVVAMPMVAYNRAWNWIAWTPVPYVQINSFFAEYSTVKDMMQRGAPINITYGIVLLLVLSAVCITVAMRVFKKRDITS
jgi:ABC-2 type transport system permease protein